MREEQDRWTTLSDLRCREVINLCDGARMGFVNDLQFDPACGQITALIVPEAGGVLGLLGRGGDAVIPWNAVEKIGEDIIFVRYTPSSPCRRPKKRFPP